MTFDVLIVGGGVAGIQCALVLGSAYKKSYAKNKKIGIIAHQKTSHLQNALFNNVLGIKPGTEGKELLISAKKQLSGLYPHVIKINEEKVISVEDSKNGFKVVTNKNNYATKSLVIALNYSKPFSIRGLEDYIEPHLRANPLKNRIQLRNENHLIKDGLYACGTIAGWRSQFAIAAGSGASVATDILTIWNNNVSAKIHDKL